MHWDHLRIGVPLGIRIKDASTEWISSIGNNSIANQWNWQGGPFIDTISNL